MAQGRILVVDDERFHREVLSDILAGAGHSTRLATSSGEALKLLGEESFDLLVTDIVMPGLDGIGLVREARRRAPGLECIAVTGHQDVRLAVDAMKAGCAEFLMKPVDRDELVTVVGRALSRVQLRREHSQLLDENVHFQKSEALYRQSLQLLATLDLERLQDLTLALLARVTDAQGAAIWIADDRGPLLLRGYRGVVDRSALPARVDPKAQEWADLLRGGAPFPASSAAAGDAFYVPLVADDEPLGLALLSDRARGAFGSEEHAAALTVADFAAIAARNARRFAAVERVGLRDRDTGAYNLAYFVDYAGKEFYKARRYARPFSLVVISVDNAEQMRKEVGKDLFRRAARGIVDAVSRVARDADILAKVSESEYYLLLPETDHFGALMFLRRAAEEIRGEEWIRKLEERCPVLVAMGAAAFPKDGEDFDELLHWARARVQEQRDSLLRRLHLGDLDRAAFWELADMLLSEQAPIPESSPSTRLAADPELFAAAQREAAREISRDPRARGLLYVGAPDAAARAPVLEALPPGEAAARAGDGAVQVYLLGPRGDALPGIARHPLVTEVFLDGDPRMSDHVFMLFIGEHAAYGLLARPDGPMFHTSDAPLVDALVSRLQALYDLQPL